MIAAALKVIQLRNPNFSFSKDLTSSMVLTFLLNTLISLLRGFKVLLKMKMPKGASFGRKVKLKYANRISFGKFLKLGNHVTLSALGTDGIHLQNNVSIGDFSSLVVSTTFDNPGKGIWLGDNVGIGEFAYLGGAGGLTIGSGCIIGQYFSCHPENHLCADLNIEIRLQGTSRKGIEIGENCWIGSKVTLLDGVKVGSGSVIAAGAVVTRSFPANSIIGGVPAKLIKTR